MFSVQNRQEFGKGSNRVGGAVAEFPDVAVAAPPDSTQLDTHSAHLAWTKHIYILVP